MYLGAPINIVLLVFGNRCSSSLLLVLLLLILCGSCKSVSWCLVDGKQNGPVLAMGSDLAWADIIDT